MLLSLTSHPNPAQILISAIQKRGGKGLLSKDEDFYLALLNPASEGGGIREAVKIMGGDPGKGALSLEMEDSLMPGQAVQVGVRLFNADSPSSCSVTHPKRRSRCLQRD